VPSRILTINGGSSTIKFGVFAVDSTPRRILNGQVDGVSKSNLILTATDSLQNRQYRVSLEGGNHRGAAESLIRWITDWGGDEAFLGIGHRVVHGGVRLNEHQIITCEVLQELRRTQPLDLAHLPFEIALIEAFQSRFSDVPQIACFDTAFHRDLPRIAQIFPIPRRYTDAGMRRLGFHGLSYMYLMHELRRIDVAAAEGRVILAHLGSGASLAAVYRGRPMDTSMAFTPTAGVIMGTRPGDFDPGLLVHIMRLEGLTPDEADQLLSRDCGLAGVSGTSSDMRELLSRRSFDAKAAEAVDLFCYSIKKYIGAYAAALGGVDTLVFSGGIGEHSPESRAGICQGLEFLGIDVDPELNSSGAAVISAPGSRVTVRIIPTDEELMVANIVSDLIRKGGSG
jgi:acetate kinase